MIFLSLGGAAFLAVLVAAVVVVVRMASADPGDEVPQPHRAAATGPGPAAGEPRWAPYGHRWTALSTAWSDDRDSGPTAVEDDHGLVSVFYYADGKDVIGVDAATGKVRHRFTSRKYVGVAGPVDAGGRLAVLTVPKSKYVTGLDDTFAVHVFAPDLKRYTSVRVPTGGAFGPERIAASGEVVALWSNNALWTLDTRKRRVLARAALPALSDVDGVIGRTALVTDRSRSGHRLAGYDLLTGRRTWTVAPFTSVITTFRTDVADGMVTAVGDGLALVDPARGKIVFRRPTFRTFGAGLAVTASGRLVIDFGAGVAGYR